MCVPPALRVLCLVALVLSGTRCPAELEALAPEKINEIEGVEHLYIGQRVSNEKVTLLPEHCFFSGDSKKLKLSGPTKAPAADPLNLNGGNSYASVDGLQSPEARVVWPFWFSSETALHGRILAKGSGSLTVSLGAVAQTVSVAGGVAEFRFEKAPKGQSELSVTSAAFSGSIERVELDGPALKGAKLLRARWRPAAIHSSFTSSNLGKEQSRLWIMEVRPNRPEKDFYSPITTPFGYFGSTFNADGSSGGINFSMWSYEAGKEEPPLAQLSHLLAVGSPKASFGGFGHEGTGVKLRDWNPYEGLKVASGVLALRLEPGKPYDTYTAYFYDQTAAAWRLFASGRKWSEQRGVQHLLPGCFVEVPGPPHIERSGHIARTADFRGWCRDAKGVWHHLDKMIGDKGDAAREQANCLWARSEDNWFRMSIGGFLHYRYPRGVDVVIPKANPLPEFLNPEKVTVLDALPTEVRVLGTVLQGDSLLAEIELGSLSRTPTQLTAFYGPTDALSFAERWEKKTELGEMAPGKRRFKLAGVPRSGFLRIQAKNETGTFFTPEPAVWK
jgi:hypothetical protein